jgi:enoyl-CoA hydratase/carnithine racemase
VPGAARAGPAQPLAYRAGDERSPDLAVIAPLAGGPIVVTRDGAVATLWLNRPEKRNAVTHAMWQGIADACGPLADDPSVRALVVRGVGEHFCAGADIGELHTIEAGTYQAATRAAEDALAGFPKPTVAHITGSCVGGGAEIAIACDLRLADTTARFGITPARLGIAYPPFAVERAVRLLGPSATKHLLFSAELIDAARALRIGLVDEVLERGGLERRVGAFTRLLAEERSALTQRASKEMVDAVVLRGGVDDALARRWADEVAASPDPAEGALAFAERRPPRFTWSGPAQG